MKKEFLVILAVLLSSSAYGQLKLGTEAGVTLFNTLHTRADAQGYEENPKYKTGLKLGIIAEYPLFRRLSVQTGVSYLSKGFRYVYYDRFYVYIDERPQLSARIDYLEVPLNLLVGIGDHLRIGVGGYFDYGIGGKAVYTSTDIDGRTHKREGELTMDNPQTESMMGFRKTDYGLLFSASYTLPLNAVVQVQFSKGLKDIMPSIPFHAKVESYKNYGFIASAGWYFAKF